LSKITAIGTAVPAYKHKQEDILHFMQQVYAMNEVEKRKLKFLYHQSAIDTRYSVLADYCKPAGEWKFYPNTEGLEPFPNLEVRMRWYEKYAAPLSVDAIRNCLEGKLNCNEITHLITVSCTGMSAPGLDLQVMDLLDLPRTIQRSSVNFMGCYAAIHALKMADAICKTEDTANVMIVCTELCTLHFQKEGTADTIASSLLFADGAAAVLVTHNSNSLKGYCIANFYSEVIPKGKKDMSWELSGSGFLMTLSGYVPDLIEADFSNLTNKALAQAGVQKNEIANWCIHPGGKRIVEAIQKSLQLQPAQLQHSYDVLREFGNMSSPTILFVLQRILKAQQQTNKQQPVFAAAFGPGLTMETFICTPE
jgi:predicted naringenin-chalcone synthase